MLHSIVYLLKIKMHISMMIELRDANFIKERLSFLLSLFNDSQDLYILYLLDTFMGQLDLRSQLNAI